MISVQLAAPKRLALVDIPEPPDPGPGELLLRVRAVGVCGSDLHWYREGRIGPVPASYPMVLGHEPAAEVVAVGAGVTRFRAGDRVAVEPTISCGHCEFCLTGRHNNCEEACFMGSPWAPGLLREYAVVPRNNATKFPAEMTFRQATLIEPLAVIMHLIDLVPIRPLDTVAVLGAGPIGMLAAAVARASGASRVIAADRLPHRLALARAMGATDVCELARLPAAVADLTGGRGVDLVLDAAGDPATINTGLTIARAGATFALIGIPVEPGTPVDLHTAMAREIRIQTLKRSNHRSASALAMLLTGAVNDALITHAEPATRACEAFDTLDGYRDGIGKLVLEFDS